LDAHGDVWSGNVLQLWSLDDLETIHNDTSFEFVEQFTNEAVRDGKRPTSVQAKIRETRSGLYLNFDRNGRAKGLKGSNNGDTLELFFDQDSEYIDHWTSSEPFYIRDSKGKYLVGKDQGAFRDMIWKEVPNPKERTAFLTEGTRATKIYLARGQGKKSNLKIQGGKSGQLIKAAEKGNQYFFLNPLSKIVQYQGFGELGEDQWEKTGQGKRVVLEKAEEFRRQKKRKTPSDSGQPSDSGGRQDKTDQEDRHDKEDRRDKEDQQDKDPSQGEDPSDPFNPGPTPSPPQDRPILQDGKIENIISDSSREIFQSGLGFMIQHVETGLYFGDNGKGNPVELFQKPSALIFQAHGKGNLRRISSKNIEDRDIFASGNVGDKIYLDKTNRRFSLQDASPDGKDVRIISSGLQFKKDGRNFVLTDGQGDKFRLILAEDLEELNSRSMAQRIGNYLDQIDSRDPPALRPLAGTYRLDIQPPSRSKEIEKTKGLPTIPEDHRRREDILSRWGDVFVVALLGSVGLSAWIFWSKNQNQ
jgi:hypothetical protein